MMGTWDRQAGLVWRVGGGWGGRVGRPRKPYQHYTPPPPSPPARLCLMLLYATSNTRSHTPSSNF